MKIIAYACLAACAAFPATASFAADSSIYLGASLGSAKQNNSLGLPYAVFSKTSDTGYKLSGGYNFNSNFGAEIEYVNLGKITQAASTYPGVGVYTGGDIKIYGWNISAVGNLPLGGGFDLFAKLGLFSSKLSGVATGNSTKASYGLGAKYAFAENWDIKGEYQYFELGTASNVPGASRAKANLWSLGMDYNF